MIICIILTRYVYRYTNETRLYLRNNSLVIYKMQLSKFDNSDYNHCSITFSSILLKLFIGYTFLDKILSSCYNIYFFSHCTWVNVI